MSRLVCATNHSCDEFYLEPSHGQRSTFRGPGLMSYVFHSVGKLTLKEVSVCAWATLENSTCIIDLFTLAGGSGSFMCRLCMCVRGLQAARPGGRGAACCLCVGYCARSLVEYKHVMNIYFADREVDVVTCCRAREGCVVAAADR